MWITYDDSSVDMEHYHVNDVSRPFEHKIKLNLYHKSYRVRIKLLSSKKLIDKIHSGQYVDFTEFPPTKGRVRTPLYNGQLLLVQMEDVASSKKLIPDFPTWAQCFTIFTAVLSAHNPTLLPDLITYLTDTATHAKRFRWSCWTQGLVPRILEALRSHFRQFTVLLWIITTMDMPWKPYEIPINFHGPWNFIIHENLPFHGFFIDTSWHCLW